MKTACNKMSVSNCGKCRLAVLNWGSYKNFEGPFNKGLHQILMSALAWIIQLDALPNASHLTGCSSNVLRGTSTSGGGSPSTHKIRLLNWKGYKMERYKTMIAEQGTADLLKVYIWLNHLEKRGGRGAKNVLGPGTGCIWNRIGQRSRKSERERETALVLTDLTALHAVYKYAPRSYKQYLFVSHLPRRACLVIYFIKNKLRST